MKFLFSLLIIFTATIALSQHNSQTGWFFNAQKLEVGPVAGLGLVIFKGTDPLNDTVAPGTSSTLGLELAYHFNKYFSVVAVPGMERRRRSAPLAVVVPGTKDAQGVHFVRKTRSWSFPVILRFSCGNTAGIQAETGFYLNYTVSQTDQNISNVVLRSANKNNVPDLQSYDAGIVAGMLFFAKNNHSTFYFGHRLYCGKMNIAPAGSNFTHFENLFMLVAGLRFEIFDGYKAKKQAAPLDNRRSSLL